MDAKKKADIIKAYQTSSNSIQEIARIFDADINEVLVLIGEGDLANVEMPGDMIDQAEAGPGAQLKGPQNVRVPFSKN